MMLQKIYQLLRSYTGLYRLPAGSPSNTSGTRQRLIWTGNGQSTTPSFINDADGIKFWTVELDPGTNNYTVVRNEVLGVVGTGTDACTLVLNLSNLVAGDRFCIKLSGVSADGQVTLDLAGSASFLLGSSINTTATIRLSSEVNYTCYFDGTNVWVFP